MLRAAGSTAALVVIYYLLPLDRSSTTVAVTLLVIGLVALMGLVTYQVRSIVRSSFPLLRGVEALATSIPLFLLLFAATYVVLATISAGNFSQPLSRTDAIYFTVTVFATVGFGDITAKTEVARLVVTGQMLADLIVLGLGVRVLLSAVQRGRQRPPATPSRPGGKWHVASPVIPQLQSGRWLPRDYLQDLETNGPTNESYRVGWSADSVPGGPLLRAAASDRAADPSPPRPSRSRESARTPSDAARSGR